MKTSVLLLLLVHGAAAGTHSLKYFYTRSSGLPNFPEYVGVGRVDGVEIVHYDSNTRRAEPRQDWMDKVTAVDPMFWERETQRFLFDQQLSKAGLEVIEQRLNQTGGVHMFQRISGCEWDDQTEHTDGFEQFGFDGEDLLSLDLKTLTWVAPKPQALAIKNEWDNNRAWLESQKHYLTVECVRWLKEYLDYGRSSLLRTDVPSVSFLQRTPTSPVTCFATGFYHDSAMMLWSKDGEDLHEDVEVGEVLPNHDGTFQMAADLTLPVDAKDHDKYDCVFQFEGIEEELVYRLDRSSIKTNERNPTHTCSSTSTSSTTTSNTIIMVALLALVLLATIGAVIYKKKKKTTTGSDSGSELSELNHDSSAAAFLD